MFVSDVQENTLICCELLFRCHGDSLQQVILETAEKWGQGREMG